MPVAVRFFRQILRRDRVPPFCLAGRARRWRYYRGCAALPRAGPAQQRQYFPRGACGRRCRGSAEYLALAGAAARATCIGVASSEAATSFNSCACNGVKPPSGKRAPRCAGRPAHPPARRRRDGQRYKGFARRRWASFSAHPRPACRHVAEADMAD